MQPLPLKDEQRWTYHQWLRSSHDFDIEVAVLDLNEKPLSKLLFLDGQVNLNSDQQVRRTASLTVIDPGDTMDWTGSPVANKDALWAKRLIRVRHIVRVPTIGEVTVTPFIGPVTALERGEGVITLECQDKSALAIRGSKPLDLRKGRNAVDAIRAILKGRAGEFRFRFPKSKRRLSKDYAVGWTEETSPWRVAKRIAKNELGRQLIYSCDGYATLRKKPTSTARSTYIRVTGYPSLGLDYTEINNYVRVLGKKWDKKTVGKGKDKHKNPNYGKRPEGIARLRPSQSFSPEYLSRKGVNRYWPEVIEDEDHKTKKQAENAAEDRLDDTSRLKAEFGITCIPFFHGDVDDLVPIVMTNGTHEVRLREASIPLGVEGEMTIGQRRWVSRPPKTAAWSKKIRWKRPQKKKPGKNKSGKK